MPDIPRRLSILAGRMVRGFGDQKPPEDTIKAVDVLLQTLKRPYKVTKKDLRTGEVIAEVKVTNKKLLDLAKKVRNDGLWDHFYRDSLGHRFGPGSDYHFLSMGDSGTLTITFTGEWWGDDTLTASMSDGSSNWWDQDFEVGDNLESIIKNLEDVTLDEAEEQKAKVFRNAMEVAHDELIRALPAIFDTDRHRAELKKLVDTWKKELL